MKPFYRVKLVSPAHTVTMPRPPNLEIPRQEGYYSAEHPWQLCPIEQADKLTHKEALQVRNHMVQSRIGYTAELEPVNEP